MLDMVLTTVTLEGTEEMGISAVIVLLSLLALIGVLILKMVFVHKLFTGEEIPKVHIFTTFVVALIAEILIQATLMVKLTVMMQIYSFLGYLLFVLVGVFFIAELILMPMGVIVGGRKQTGYMRKG